jgi:hypothetical protein
MTERNLIGYYRAIVKFNNGNGALLCNRCLKSIANGIRHRDVEHYCSEACRNGRVVASPEAFPDSVIERIRRIEEEQS